MSLRGISEFDYNMAPQLKVLDNGTSNVCNSTVPNGAITVKGSFSFLGSDNAKFNIFGKDQQGNKIYLKTMFGKNASINQPGRPQDWQEFKFYILSDDICEALPGKELTVGEVSEYIRQLALEPELVQ